MTGIVQRLSTVTIAALMTTMLYAGISSPDGGGYVYEDGISEFMTSIVTGGSETAVTWSTSGSHSYSTTKIPLGFTFNYYGTDYDSIYIMSGGWLSFTDREYNIPDESTLPDSTDVCGGVIAPLAITFETDPVVYYETQGTFPNRTFSVEWDNVLTTDFEAFTFQIIFSEWNNTIKVVYDLLADGWGSSIQNAHVGIESPDEKYGHDVYLGATYDGGAPEPTSGEALLFGKPLAITSPAYDTTVTGAFNVYWEEICGTGTAPIVLCWDEGTDTTGTPFDTVQVQDADDVSWNLDGVPLLTPVYVYGVLIDGTDTTVSYSKGRITKDHGPIDSLAVTPVSASVEIGSTLVLTATAYDANKFSWDVTDTVLTTWTTDDASVTVDSGRYTADSLGSYKVWAVNGGYSDTCVITVSHGPIAVLTVSPGSNAITTDSTLQLTATAEDAYSNTWDVTSTATWGTDDASVTVTDGSYDPDSSGSYIVFAASGGVGDTVTVTVRHGAAVSFNVSPASQSLTADDTLILSAMASDADGVAWDVTDTSATAWTATGSKTAISGGVYRADTVGTHYLAAEYDGFRDTCAATVTAGAIAVVTVTPSSADVTTDSTLTLIAAAADADGNIWDITADASGTAWGTDEPSNNVADGSYAPDLVGLYKVWAVNAGFSDTCAVTVAHGLTVTLVVTPSSQSMTADDTLILTATAADADGNTWDVTDTAATVWTSTGSKTAVTGGVYRADTAGTHYLVAGYDGFSDTCVATVGHGALTSLNVTPDTYGMSSDDTLLASAEATDADGNTWDVTTAATWKSNEPGNLNLTDGLYAPDTPGDYKVYASSVGIGDTCFVTVTHGATDRVVLNPVSQAVTADDTVAFSARAYDVDNNFWSILDSSGTSWSAPGTKTVVTGGVYRADTVGIWTVIVGYDGYTDTSVVTVTHGTLVSLAVAPQTDTITADDTLQYTATGTDGDGNTWSETATATWSAVGPQILVLSAGVFKPVADGDYIVSATSGSLSDTADVTVLYGATVQLVVTPASDAVTADDTVQMTATASDADGNTWDVTDIPTTTWTTSGTKDSVVGGVYRADTAGVQRAVAAYEGFTDTCVITVTHGASVQLTVTGSLDTVALGDTVSYTAIQIDADGNTWDVTATATWQAEGPATRNFVAGIWEPDMLGSYIVFASDAGLQDTVDLVVDPTVPVELASFTAAVEGQAVNLAWQTVSESNNLGWHVLRSGSVDGPYEQVTSALIPGGGTVNDPRVYSFVDETPLAGTNYYLLKQIDLDGSVTLAGPVTVDMENTGMENDVMENPAVYGIPAGTVLFTLEGRQAGTVNRVNKGIYLYQYKGVWNKVIIIK